MTARERLRRVCLDTLVPDASPENPVMVTVQRGDVSAAVRVISAAEMLEMRRAIIADLKCRPTPPHEMALARRNYRTAWQVLRACLHDMAHDRALSGGEGGA